MFKQNKGKLIISSLLVLLPMFIGLIFWNFFPKEMIMHWGIDGQANQMGGKIVPIVILPLILLVVHWFCILFTFLDKKNARQSEKVMGIVFWVAPVTSIFTSAIIYLTSMEVDFSVEVLVFALLGVMFIGIGNYLPKCKQNTTIGIKSIWALQDEENWNATHRFSGKIWVIGGFVILASSFLPGVLRPIFMIIAIVILVVVPFTYSYLFYRKKKKAGLPVVDTNPAEKSNMKWIIIISFVFTLVILGFVGVMLCTGDINYTCGTDTLEVKASYWGDIAISYDKIESVDYQKDTDVGMRTNGFGSPRLEMGSFENDSYGNYTRYTYTKGTNCVVLRVDGQIVVLGGQDEAATQQLYDDIKKCMNE